MLASVLALSALVEEFRHLICACFRCGQFTISTAYTSKFCLFCILISQAIASLALDSAASYNSFDLDSAAAKAFLAASDSAIYLTIGFDMAFWKIGWCVTNYFARLNKFHCSSSKASSFAEIAAI